MEYNNLKKRKVQEQRDLERKFEPLFASVCAARRAVVTGEVDPVAGAAGVKGVPEFWLRAMKNCRAIADYVEPHDEPVLKYLTDVTTAFVGDLAGFRVDFHFAANPYFENAVLSKVFHIPHMIEGAPEAEGGAAAAAEEEEDEEDDEDAFDVKKIEGTEVQWKAGHNVTVKVVKKKSKGKGKGGGKTITKEEELPSFFRFFETPDMEAAQDDDEEVRFGGARCHSAGWGLCVCVCFAWCAAA